MKAVLAMVAVMMTACICLGADVPKFDCVTDARGNVTCREATAFASSDVLCASGSCTATSVFSRSSTTTTQSVAMSGGARQVLFPRARNFLAEIRHNRPKLLTGRFLQALGRARCR